MGKPLPGQENHHGSASEVAVTPVIGAILILVISVLGIAGVLFWGAPMIERIQAQNAQVAMVGEFEDLRDSSRELSVPDHSRFPTVVLGRGDLNLERGSRIMVTVNYDLNCDFHVTGWANSDNENYATQTNCNAPTTVRLFTVSGGTLIEKTPAATGYDYDGPLRDWLWRLESTDPACPSGVCAEAWLVSTDQISWSMRSGSGERDVRLDMGAIFSNTAGTTFLEKEPIIGDSAFGPTYYGLWLRSLDAASLNGFSGSGSHQVYLSLVGNHIRSDAASVGSLRFDFYGDLAEAWCNALVNRNSDLTGAAYTSQGADCAAIDGSGVRSVTYSRTGGATFAFKLLHARIYTSLVV